MILYRFLRDFDARFDFADVNFVYGGDFAVMAPMATTFFTFS